MIFTTDSVFNRAYKYQVLAALTVNVLAFSHGIGLGWASPTLAKLQSDESPIGIFITVEEASWIGALLSVGGLTGNLLFGLLLNRIGRKMTLMLLPIAHVCFWLTVFFATEVHHLYIARLLAGTCGGGTFCTIPIYVAEIADSKIRGRLGSLFLLVLSIGTLAGFILASYIPYKLIPCLTIILPFIYLVSLSFFPDTPQYLLRIGNETKAETSMKFYKNFKSLTDKEGLKKFNEDFNDMKLAVNAPTSTDENNKLTWRDFCKADAVSSIGITLALLTLYNFSGIFTIMNYSASIFGESGSQLDPNASTIILGVIQICGTYMATLLIDRLGRKILLVVSSFGACLGLTLSGAFVLTSKQYDLSAFSWVPVVTLSFVIFIANIGVMSVCIVVVAEILPTKIRTVATAVCFCISSAMSFAILKIFPILMATYGFHGAMWFCATFCGLGTIFVIFCVPETKGISLDKKRDDA